MIQGTLFPSPEDTQPEPSSLPRKEHKKGPHTRPRKVHHVYRDLDAFTTYRRDTPTGSRMRLGHGFRPSNDNALTPSLPYVYVPR